LKSCYPEECGRLQNIQKHINKNKLIINQQSGFRAHRQAKDNLFSICQRSIQNIKKKVKTCAIFFDIASAFDRFRHNGLIYKLCKLKFPLYLITILIDYLAERYFVVKLNEISSEPTPISQGVPQSGVL
jgi:hypothetical protein